MRIVLDYKSCPPSSYGKGFMEELYKKVEAIEENIETMTFIEQTFDDNNMLVNTEEYTLTDKKAKVLAVELDLDCAGDEMYLALDTEIEHIKGGNGIKNFTDALYIEVVTKEVAESNDRDLLDGEYNDLVESGYEVGDDNSYYKQIGNTEFYYREM